MQKDAMAAEELEHIICDGGRTIEEMRGPVPEKTPFRKPEKQFRVAFGRL